MSISEQEAREILNKSLNDFMEEVREVIQRKVHDSISVEADIEGAEEGRVTQIVLGWVQRIMLEKVHDEFGPKATAFVFDNAYYQIASQKIGPNDFTDKAQPYGR